MTPAIASARSGMIASLARLNASASNIANSQTTGPLRASAAAAPTDDAGPGAPRVSPPVDVVLRSTDGQSGVSGVAASYRPRSPASVQRYDPTAPFADADGLVAAPNVDLAEEAVGLIEASLLLRANLAVLKAADAMTKGMLDTTA